jgi:arylsulfatase A-like enzyme
MNVLPALLGESGQARDHLVHHANSLALRFGPWKYIPPGMGNRVNANTNTETGIDPQGQLYNLETDPGERTNLASQHPDRLKAMADRLEAIRQSARTRPVK